MNIQELDIMGAGDVCKFLDICRSRLSFLIKKYNIPYKEVSSGKIFLKKDIIAFQEARKDKMKHKKK